MKRPAILQSRCFCPIIAVRWFNNTVQIESLEYGLGSGCYAEQRVGESIGSKQHDRNKLVKTEGRPNELENLVPLNHQEKRLLFHNIVTMAGWCLIRV